MSQRSGAELRELRGRRELAVEERATAALGLDDATHDELAVARHAGGLELRSDARARLDLEERSDLGLTGAVADVLRTGAAAEHERQGVDDHRLACAGLTGEHVEARPELEDLMLDEDDVVDRQREQHASAEYSSQSGRSSVVRRNRTEVRPHRTWGSGPTSRRGGASGRIELGARVPTTRKRWAFGPRRFDALPPPPTHI